MLRIWMLCLCLCSACWALGQTTGNPFDLTFRKPIQPVITTPVIADTAAAIIPNPPSEALKSGEDTSIQMIGKMPEMQHADTLPVNPFEKNAALQEEKAIQAPVTQQPDPATQTQPVREKLPVIKAARGFQIFFLLISLLFLIFIVNVERSFVRDLWRVIANENYSSLHHRNQRNTMRQILQIMGYIVFILQAGLFIFHALSFYGYSGRIQVNIFVPVLFVAGIYFIRHLVIHYLRWLFNNQKEMVLFGFDISIFNTMIGLILLPINILLLFGPETLAKPLIIIGIITFVAAYLMRQFRWVLTARQLIANSLFLFFIYLCAVEILPLWAISTYFW